MAKKGKITCQSCGNSRREESRGLCYKCYADRSIRDAALFRGRAAVLPESEACKHCKRRKAIKGKRWLCLECWRTPLIREQYPHGGRRKREPVLSEPQRAFIAEMVPVLRDYVYGLARRWGIIASDRDELFSAAMEIVCRRGCRLRLEGEGINPASFLKCAAVHGMRWACKHGPLRRPNTVYLSDSDTDGRSILKRRKVLESA